MATVDISWEKDAWTGDDGPFANARRAIDNAFRSNTDLTKIISEYSFDAKANPQDSLDQFKWAYAFYLQGSIPHQEERNITPVLQGLIFAKQPLTYNYARLRLLYTIAGPGDRSLEERLLARDPSDTPVLYRYAFSLSQSNSREDVEKAIKVGQKLLSSGQDSANAYLDLTYIYVNASYIEPGRLYDKKAIDAGKRYLELTPPNDFRRSGVVHIIKYFQAREKV